MKLTSFSVIIYEGQSATPRLTFSNTDTTQCDFKEIKFNKSENSLFQSGTLVMFKGIAEPVVNDKVVIIINGTTRFTGYVSGISRELKGN